MIGRLLNRLRGARATDRMRQAELLLAVLEELGKGAKTITEFRNRVAQGAQRGDLDDTISWAAKRDKTVNDFIEGR